MKRSPAMTNLSYGYCSVLVLGIDSYQKDKFVSKLNGIPLNEPIQEQNYVPQCISAKYKYKVKNGSYRSGISVYKLCENSQFINDPKIFQRSYYAFFIFSQTLEGSLQYIINMQQSSSFRLSCKKVFVEVTNQQYEDDENAVSYCSNNDIIYIRLNDNMRQIHQMIWSITGLDYYGRNLP